MKLVIDTNIFISALIKREGLTRNIMLNSDNYFFFPEYEFQEIYKYKDDILKKSEYSEAEFIVAMAALLNNIHIISYEEIRSSYDEACNIMNSIDSGDTIFIATALAFDALIWSDDQHFKKQNRIKCLTTEDMKNLQY